MNEKKGADVGQGSGRKMLGGIVWCVLAAVGLIGLYHRMSTGHHTSGYGSYMPWGIWVALYFYGVGMAAGVFLVGGLGFLSGKAGLQTKAMLRSTIVLSLAALLPGLLGIGLDLGRFDRAMRLFIDPNFTSVLTLNTWLYTFFMLAAALAWLVSWRRDSVWLKPLVAFGALTCLLFAMGSGMFFAAVQVKPYWHNGIWPVMTLVSGLTAGAAVLLLTRCAATGSPSDAVKNAGCLLARRVMQGGLVVYLLLTGVKWMVAHGYDAAGQAVSRPEPFYSSAWLQILVGIVLPLLLLATNRRAGWLAAAVLAAIGLLGGRMDLLLGGQTPAEMPGLPEAFQHLRLSFVYRPTAMEWQVAALLLAIGIAVYFIGQMVNRTTAARLATEDQGEHRDDKR